MAHRVQLCFSVDGVRHAGNAPARLLRRRAGGALAGDVGDPVSSAEVAGLRWVTDAEPGIRRVRRAGGFSYPGRDGRAVRDPAVLRRIRELVIPPAWTNVWISPYADGHLQATGRDARGRKQYRYHARWRDVRDGTKFERLVAFADALPRIRKRVERDLRRRGLPREKVLATVVRLLEITRMRVGNEEYARTNDSFGLTTLRDRHVGFQGGSMRFSFRGKSGKRHVLDVHDPRLAGIVRRCQAIPGQELFQYIDEHGNEHSIGSTHVNDYLREITGADFTSKDFRTWGGTLMAAEELAQRADAPRRTVFKQVVAAIQAVADGLGNTASVCRKSYVHPAVIQAYLEGRWQKGPMNEQAVITLLRREAASAAAA